VKILQHVDERLRAENEALKEENNRLNAKQSASLPSEQPRPGVISVLRRIIGP
jgi:hypothetical protein